jgi:putative Ca2+/H+ antiporter (TMEM165/GDT1 family)
MTLYRFLADLVVVFHGAYVAFVVFGLVAILVGIARNWGWVRNFWFRVVHFLAIAYVAFEEGLGFACPITTLENHLREMAGDATYPGSFIGHCVHHMLFYECPQWIFTVLHIVFAVAVLATLILAPPRWPWARDEA